VVRDQLGRAPRTKYVVFEHIDQMLREFHQINIDNISVPAYKDLATSRAGIDGRCITVEFLGGNSFSLFNDI